MRRLFRCIAATAAPFPFALGAPACGGTVADRSQLVDTTEDTGGAGGSPVYVGRIATGGKGGTGGRGVPLFTGSTGGSIPIFTGTGGTPVYAGYADAMPHPPAWDAGLPCEHPPALACMSYCVPMGPVDGDAGGSLNDGGTLSRAECSALCNGNPNIAFPCSMFIYEGMYYLNCQPLCLGGRRPEGLVAATFSRANHLAKFFVDMARLEAASIPAFRILRRELALHGAPKRLLRSARAAARDEIRHARVARGFARRFGGRYLPPVILAKPVRSLEAIAVENAVEGCVRETFGAMMATWQAETATDPEIRNAMRRIALDETRHAALALRVAKWAERRLDDAARGRVRAAHREAVAAVFGELDYEVPAELASIAGVPSGAQARLMAAALDQHLWTLSSSA